MDRFDIPDGYGKEFRAQFDWLKDRPLLLYAGTLGFVNGVGYFVYLAETLLHMSDKIRCLVIGDGRETDEIRKLAAQRGVLNRNFFMLEPQPKYKIPSVFSAATITTSFVRDVPALWANSANKFFDSLAAGRPIAINHEGWQADLLRKTGAGIVLPAIDYAEAARKILNLVRDKVRLEASKKNARELAYNRFHYDSMAQQLYHIFDQAVAKVDHANT